MLLSGTGPFTKMGLDNPDTLYFGCRVQPDHDYLVTGIRGTTTDLSFQLLGGEYTDDNVPASQAAFDDRELEIAADGSFQWQVRPTSPGQLVIREVYGDWSQQRGTLAIQRLDTAGTAPPPLTRAAIEKRYATAGKQLVNRIKTWLQFPQWFYLDIPVNTMVAAPADARRSGDAVLLGRALRAAARSGPDHHAAGDRRALPRLPAGQHVVHLAGLHQPPDLAEFHSGPSGSGRQDSYRRRRPEPRRHQLGRNARASPRIPAVPLAAGVAPANRSRRTRRRAGRHRHCPGQAAVLPGQQDFRRCLARANCAAPNDKLRQGCWDDQTCSTARLW